MFFDQKGLLKSLVGIPCLFYLLFPPQAINVCKWTYVGDKMQGVADKLVDKVEGTEDEVVATVRARPKESVALLLGGLALTLVGIGAQVYHSANRQPQHELYRHSVAMFYTPDHHIIYLAPRDQFWWLSNATNAEGMLTTAVMTDGTIDGNWIKGRALTDEEQASSTLIHETITLDENGAPGNATLPFKHL